MKSLPEPPPTILVIFGITGHLSQRYLMPALHEIDKEKQMPKKYKIYGVTRQSIDYGGLLKKFVNRDAMKSLRHFKRNFEVFTMDLGKSEDYRAFKSRLLEDTKKMGKNCQIIFHLAMPPDSVPSVVRHLGKSGLKTPNVKLLMEKPFGTDTSSSQVLNDQISRFFKEEQVYRVDHYLAKGMAKNISVFISANALFRDVWSRHFIEKIEILASEKIGIEGRTTFYEQTGALKDFLQNHLLQLAALVLMHPCPDPLDFEDMAERRLAALKALLPLGSKSKVVRGQYKGYRAEAGDPKSTTETFISATFYSDDDRWHGVPVHLATGKKLDKRYSVINVYFKKIRHSQANRLTMRIQPNGGMELELWTRRPGYHFDLEKVNLSYSFKEFYKHLPEPYEQILIDVFRSNRSLFPTSDEIIAAWRVIEPLQKRWAKTSKDLIIYKPGSSIEQILKSA